MGCISSDCGIKPFNPRVNSLKPSVSSEYIGEPPSACRNIEILPGVLLYRISEYAGRESVPLIECLSSKIQLKLKSNLSAF